MDLGKGGFDGIADLVKGMDPEIMKKMMDKMDGETLEKGRSFFFWKDEI